MTSESRLMSGIILITVPTIQYGGYFSAYLADEPKFGIHGQRIAPEFLSGWPCSRWRNRIALAHLPSARGCRRIAVAPGMVYSDWGAALCDSHFSRILRFDALADGCAAKRSRCSDLYRSDHPGDQRSEARDRFVAWATTKLKRRSAFMSKFRSTSPIDSRGSGMARRTAGEFSRSIPLTVHWASNRSLARCCEPRL